MSTADHAGTRGGGWRRERSDLVRGASGGFLFGVPLLYTMEVWWIGSFATPPRMAAALIAAFALVFLLTLTGGFRDDEAGKLGDTLIETVQAVGFSLLFSAAILVLLRRVTFETPLDEAWLTPEVVELLDSTFVGSFAAGPRLLELLEERGYTGWTDIRPIA